jgi:hypothetical protein
MYFFIFGFLKLFHIDLLLILVINGLLLKFTEICKIVMSTVDTPGVLIAKWNRTVSNGLLSGNFSE